jgi:lipopolysaccharide/colanic/teichoic acid biosynthesis glycosyltransferase
MMTRLLDILFSIVALLILAPLLLLVMLVLRFSGEGKVFYLQHRIGKFGGIFYLFKFATMLEDSPNMGTGTVTVKGDQRVLPVGRILRKTKINELPQLFNILLGQMSLIGPRPLTEQTFRAYSLEVQTEVVKVRPGLSGIGSIIFRDEESILDGQNASFDFYSNVVAPYKGQLEVWFVANNNIKNYFLLALSTVIVVMFTNSKIVWKLFPNLPKPLPDLEKLL